MKKMILFTGPTKSLRLRAITLICAAMVSFFSISGVAVAQNDSGAQAPAQVTLKLKDVDIRILIETVAEVTGKNFVVDPRVKGKVHVISGKSLDPDKLYDMFLSILEVHNFATVESGGVIKVLPSNVIKQRPTRTLFTPTENNNDEQITQIIHLTHASVQELVAIIRPLIPPTSHFAPHTPSNSVVLTDTAANIQRVLKIIKRIDVPDERSNTRIVYLDKAKASDLAATLTQLVTASADPKTAASSPKVSIQAFDAINALMISATDTEYEKLRALINELDIERELTSDVNVIYLKYAKAEELVTILNDITASKTEGVVSDFSVQADEATNSLIVKASGNQLKSVQGVIEKLDLRRPQVFVETVIAEVSLNQAANLGISWQVGGARTPGESTTTTDSEGNVTTTPRALGNLVDELDESKVLGTATLGFSEGGLNFDLLDFKKYSLDVIINALRSDSNSNILSTPNLLTLDNESAEIVVGQEVPFITGSFNNGFNNSSSTDTNGNVTNTSGNSFQTIERKDVGIKLKIKPQINDGNTIQLEVLQEISSVSNTTVQGQADLITNRRSIEAVVQVDDGQVVVLGGLIQDDVVDTVERIPVLGSLPIIGALFRNKTKTAVKRNLMVFLKPRIVRSPEELAKYSKQKYDEVRRDGQISRLNSSKFLIDDADPPVLVEYEEGLDDGVLGSERRLEEIENTERGRPPRKGVLRHLQKGVDRVFPPAELPKESEIETSRHKDMKPEPKYQTDGTIEDAEANLDIIEWGNSPPPPPPQSDDPDEFIP